MACALTSGRAVQCKDQAGGLKTVYFTEFTADLFTGATITSGEITALATPIPAFKYFLQGELHSVDETGNLSRDNGTGFFEQTGTLVLQTLTAADRDELKLLMSNRPHIMVEDYNGNIRLFGFENGCDVSVTSSSGAAFGDLSGYTLTFTAKESEMAPFVDASLIDNVAGFTPIT